MLTLWLSMNIRGQGTLLLFLFHTHGCVLSNFFSGGDMLLLDEICFMQVGVNSMCAAVRASVNRGSGECTT